MLTENIRTLCATFRTYTTDGMKLAPAACTTIAVLLDDMAEQAEALEEIARQVAKHHCIPEDVLRIAALLHRDGVAAGPGALGKSRTRPQLVTE